MRTELWSKHQWMKSTNPCISKAEWVLIHLALVILLALTVVPVHAQNLETLRIAEQAQRNLSADVRWLRETGDKLEASTIAASPQRYDWRKIDSGTLNLGLDSTPIWLALKLETSSDVRRYFSIDYPPLDDVEFHLFRDGKRIREVITGDTRPFESRPIPYHTFVFPLDLEPGHEYLLLAHIQTEGSLQVPLTLWTPEAFIRVSEGATALQMMFLGIMATLAIYNLLVYFAVRDKAYLWYVLYLSSFVLAQAAVRGLGFQYLWPGFPMINAISIPFLFSMALATAGFFAHQFLHVGYYSRVWSMIIRGIALSGIILSLLSLILEYQTIIGLLIIFVSGGAVIIFIGACYLWWRGEMLARFYVIAWSIFLAANSVYSLSIGGILPANTLIEYSPQIGAVIQMLLLSLALAWRINEERERRQKAQAEALRIQQEANEQLEARVQERTGELRDAYDKLKKMSEMDGLTQLKNRPYFDQALEREWRRNTREIRTICLLMLDLDYFKTVNDTLGHQCGDAALRHVAEICRNSVGRAADVVARYGGEEFVILLPVTTMQGAAHIAERIRKDTESQAFYWNGERIHLTLSIGVSGCIPSNTRDYEWLVRHADEALYDAKNQGRNWTRVTIEYDDGRIETVDGSELVRVDE